MFVNTNSTVVKTNKYGMRGLYAKRSIGGDKLQASRMSITHADDPCASVAVVRGLYASPGIVGHLPPPLCEHHFFELCCDFPFLFVCG